jgi:hypothetical protein
MFRPSDIALIRVMVAAAAFTYQVKRGAEAELQQIRRLQAQIRLENDTIDVLKADWSLLTQPARLQKLVAVYQSQLALEPVSPRQIVTLDALPERPPQADPVAGLIDRMAGEKPDRSIVTSGVKQ